MIKRCRFAAIGLASVLFLGFLPTSAPAADPAADGRELFHSLGCKGCHAIDGNGGKLGPSLDGVSARLKKGAIRQKLLTPAAGNPDTRMPSYDHLSPANLKVLVDYLSSLR